MIFEQSGGLPALGVAQQGEFRAAVRELPALAVISLAR